MILNGLPDFSRPLLIGTGRGYFRYHQDGVVVLPHMAKLPFDAAGLPKLGLQLLRPSSPFLGNNNGQAILSLTLEPIFDYEGVRNYLDQTHNVMSIQPCVIDRGNVYFSSPEQFSDSGISDELESCKPLSIYGGMAQNLTIHLSAIAGAFWKQLISDGVLLVNTKLNYRIKGVSPRLDYKVGFNPVELLVSLDTIAEQRSLKQDGALSFASLVKIVDENLEALPLSLMSIGSTAESFTASESLDQITRPLFIEALVDRITDRFATTTFVNKRDELCSILPSSDEFGAGVFEWNMSQPLASERLWTISASPFDAMHSRLSDAQLSELIEEHELPFIGTNKSQLFVYANFADNAKSVLSLAANIYQDARPPDRPVPLDKTIEFTWADLSASVFLHNNRDNTISYSVAGLVVLKTDRGIIHCRGTTTPSNESLLVLGPQHFSVTPIAFSLGSSWHDSFNADIELGFEHDGRAHKMNGSLDANTPDFQFIVPKNALNINGVVLLRDRSSGDTIENPFSGISSMIINHFAYPQCGAQTVQIMGEFSNAVSWHAVELRPASNGAQAAPEISVIHLTPSDPDSVWSWFSHSPFEAAYQYRVLDSLGQPKNDWLTVEYPYPPLHLGTFDNQNIEPPVVTGSL